MYLFASVAGLIFLWRRVLNNQRRPRFLSCAECGCPTQGLEGTKCSRCGADLLENWILVHKRSEKDLDHLFVFWWTMLLLVLTVALVGLLDLHGPKTQNIEFNLSLNPESSGEYAMVQILGTGTPTIRQVSLRVQGTGFFSQQVGVDIPKKIITDPPGHIPTNQPIKPLDFEGVSQLFRSVGADTSSPAVRAEVEALIIFIGEIGGQGSRPMCQLTSHNFHSGHSTVHLKGRPHGLVWY